MNCDACKICSQKILDNVELGQLITEATVFLECQMTLAKIKIIIKEEEKNKKAVYEDFQDWLLINEKFFCIYFSNFDVLQCRVCWILHMQR